MANKIIEAYEKAKEEKSGVTTVDGVLVEELPEDQKEVVRMRYFMQMSFKDIADKSGVSINTSLGRMRYALINLRKLIAEKKLILTNS